MTTPPQAKGIVVFLMLADTDNDSKPLVFKDANDWEYNSGRLTLKNINNDRVAEFAQGAYLGVAFKDQVKLKDPVVTPPPATGNAK